MVDLLVINGRYPDFDKKELVSANIGIKDGKIYYIGNEKPEAESVIDAEGRIVSPGFIDIHMHEEDFSEGHHFSIGNLMLGQGVTTCLGGNCGDTFQPVSEFKNIIKELGGSPVNYGLLSGYNTYRRALGLDHFERSTEEQRKIACEKVCKDLEEGAFGISFGLEYDPGVSFEEMVRACNCVSDESLMVAAHYREDTMVNFDGLREFFALLGRTGKNVQISHLSSCSASGQMEESLRMINEEIKKNPRLSFDTYPYNAFSTTIGSAVFDPGWQEEMKKSYEAILLTDDPYKNQFATEESFNDCRKNHPEMLVVGFVMNEDEITAAVANPLGMVASDGLIKNGKGHPRAAGTFPRVLGKYVREKKSLDMISALEKISYRPAVRLHLEDRKGVIKLGADADITIFNPDTINDGPDFSDLHIKNIGIDYVIISGKIAVKDGEILNDRLGRFIEHKLK